MYFTACKPNREITPELGYEYQPINNGSYWIYQNKEGVFDTISVAMADTSLDSTIYKRITYGMVDTVNNYMRNKDGFLYQYVNQKGVNLPLSYSFISKFLSMKEMPLLKQNAKVGEMWKTTFMYYLDEYRLTGKVIEDGLQVQYQDITYKEVAKVVYDVQYRRARIIPIGDTALWQSVAGNSPDTFYFAKNIGNIGDLKNRNLYKYFINK